VTNARLAAAPEPANARWVDRYARSIKVYRRILLCEVSVGGGALELRHSSGSSTVQELCVPEAHMLLAPGNESGGAAA
jgi:hypothetical protein